MYHWHCSTSTVTTNIQRISGWEVATHVERRRNRDTFPTCMDICTDRPYVAGCEGIKRRRTKGQRSLRTPVILDRAANENVWALMDFRYAGDSTE